MGLEAATYISQLTAANPTTADNVSQGDDHIRLLKTVLQAQFPNLGAAAVTATAAELNIIDGVTASTAELNVLDGIPGTLTATELGYVDGVTSAIQTQLDAKAPLASPTFTGTPSLPTGTTATTQTANDNSTKLATTAYADAAAYTTAGRWKQIGTTQTASASATIDFVNGTGGVVIDSTYDLYMVEIVDARPATGAVQLWMRTSTNAGVAYATATYQHQRISAQTDATSTVTAAGSNSAAAIVMSDDQSNAGVAQAFNGQVLFWMPSATDVCHVQWRGSYGDATGASIFVTVSGMGLQEATGDVDAVRFMFSSGNITSGTFRLFGRVK